jgi:hypothetical protein
MCSRCSSAIGAAFYFSGHSHTMQHLRHNRVNYVVSGCGAASQFQSLELVQRAAGLAALLSSGRARHRPVGQCSLRDRASGGFASVTIHNATECVISLYEQHRPSALCVHDAQPTLSALTSRASADRCLSIVVLTLRQSQCRCRRRRPTRRWQCRRGPTMQTRALRQSLQMHHCVGAAAFVLSVSLLSLAALASALKSSSVSPNSSSATRSALRLAPPLRPLCAESMPTKMLIKVVERRGGGGGSGPIRL